MLVEAGDLAGQAAGFAERAVKHFHDGDHQAALDFALRCVASDDVDDASLDLCLWLANTLQRIEFALEIGRKLCDRSPDNSERWRTLSSLELQSGFIDRGLAAATRACNSLPHKPEHFIHAGGLLIQFERYGEAATYMLEAARAAPETPGIYHLLAYVADKLGHLKLATDLASQAYSISGSADSALFASHLFDKQGDRARALSILRHCAASGGSTAALQRTISSLSMVDGDLATALDAVDLALAIEPANPEFHVHRSGILLLLGRHDHAREAILRALELAPGDLGFRRHAVSVLIEGGHMDEAMKMGASLLANAPDNGEYASCMRFLLESRMEHVAARSFGEIADLKAGTPRRAYRARPGFGQALTTQMGVIGALVLRDIRGRYGESRIGFFWALMEPFLHIGVLAIVFQFTMHGRPPLGDDYFLFYFTGVVPYLLLSHLIMHVGHSVKDSRYLLQIPRITPFDLILAKGIVELFTTAVILLIFTALFLLFGIDALPGDVVAVMCAYLLTFILGLGLGSLLASLHEFGNGAEQVAGLLLRFTYFASGIFYVPGKMPVFLREILVWNPFLNIVDLNRTGYFTTYAPFWDDMAYAAVSSVVLLAIGLTALATMSKRMRVLHA